MALKGRRQFNWKEKSSTFFKSISETKVRSFFETHAIFYFFYEKFFNTRENNNYTHLDIAAIADV